MPKISLENKDSNNPGNINTMSNSIACIPLKRQNLLKFWFLATPKYAAKNGIKFPRGNVATIFTIGKSGCNIIIAAGNAAKKYREYLRPDINGSKYGRNATTRSETGTKDVPPPPAFVWTTTILLLSVVVVLVVANIDRDEEEGEEREQQHAAVDDEFFEFILKVCCLSLSLPLPIRSERVWGRRKRHLLLKSFWREEEESTTKVVLFVVVESIFSITYTIEVKTKEKISKAVTCLTVWLLLFQKRKRRESLSHQTAAKKVFFWVFVEYVMWMYVQQDYERELMLSAHVVF